jgi:hypothetical protein
MATTTATTATTAMPAATGSQTGMREEVPAEVGGGGGGTLEDSGG